MNKHIYGYIIIGIIALLLIVGIKDLINPPMSIPASEVITIRDTITRVKTDTLTLKFPVVKTKTLYKIDTLVLTEAFEKSIDTTFADSSRLQISYFFPGDTFKIKLQTAITEIIRRDSIKTYLPIKTECPKDYTTPFIIGTAGVVGGIIIGVLISK